MQEEMKNCRKYAPKKKTNITRHIEHEAGGAAFSIRQDWTDTRENDGREGESSARRERTAKR